MIVVFDWFNVVVVIVNDVVVVMIGIFEKSLNYRGDFAHKSFFCIP